MKKRTVLSCLLAVVIVIVCVLLWIGFKLQDKENAGVQSIHIVEKGDDQLILDVNYFTEVNGYKVENVPEDEMEEVGERKIPYDGSIGKYRVKISFYDAQMSEKFCEKYPVWVSHELLPAKEGEEKGVGLRIGYHADHGFYFYIGSDEPLTVEDTEFTEVPELMGTIRVVIKK